jgi:transcriptional regulator with XRE-family HTH domain
MDVSEVIKQRRQELGMSQADLAKAVGIDPRQIRRYEAGQQQPLLSVALAIADALSISVSELAGRSSHRVTVTGEWWTSWQTFRSGEQKIATQPVRMRQETDRVHIAALRRGLSSDEGGYLWTGELRLWDNEVFTGWYAADDGSIRSKGTIYWIMHTHGVNMTGRWVGLGYDDKVMTGWSTVAKSPEEAEAMMSDLIEPKNGEPK